MTQFMTKPAATTGFETPREEFLFPKTPSGSDYLYFAGNSLGLQPRKARQYIEEELEDWARLGVEGHLKARHPWLPYHEFLTESLARLVGAKSTEVVAMNTLSVNLHLMMVSFYRPTKTRYKILIEGGAFPSDQYAVASQARFHAGAQGFDAASTIVELKPRAGEDALRPEDILATIHAHRDSLALVMLGNTNYLTGQCFDVAAITRAAHAAGAFCGWDLAHGAGSLEFKLNEWGPDFAVWCSYKYLNSGPGALGGCFVHERHHGDSSIPRFEGWWGHDKATRFKMGPRFEPIRSAEAWQLSNPPIFQLAAMRASLEIFDRYGMAALRRQSLALTSRLAEGVRQIAGLKIVTPLEESSRGGHLSIRVPGSHRDWVLELEKLGVIADGREPDIIRLAPTALYTTLADVERLVECVAHCARKVGS
ncbi:MAG: kynureninase [Oligoflexia bacterium]